MATSCDALGLGCALDCCRRDSSAFNATALEEDLKSQVYWSKYLRLSASATSFVAKALVDRGRGVDKSLDRCRYFHKPVRPIVL